jgi:glycosyltransferase involved in cell wall biosynthesis
VSLVPPQDVGSLANAIEALATQSESATRMRTSALRAMQERSWESIAQKTNDFYRRLIAARGEEVLRESPQRA